MDRPNPKPLTYKERALLSSYLYGARVEKLSIVAIAHGISPEEAEEILGKFNQIFRKEVFMQKLGGKYNEKNYQGRQ